MEPSQKKRSIPKKPAKSTKQASATQKKKRPSASKTRDPLIAPFIYQLSDSLKAGNLKLATREEYLETFSPEHVPKPFDKFLRNPSLVHLYQVLEENPWLYWHQIVAVEMAHLLDVHSHPIRYGLQDWMEQDEDASLVQGSPVWFLRPDKSEQLLEAKQKLIEAHAKGLFPAWGIHWKWTVGQAGAPRKIKSHLPRLFEYLGDTQEPELLQQWYQLRNAISLQLGTTLRMNPRKIDKPKLVQQVMQVVLNTVPVWAKLWVMAIHQKAEQPDEHQTSFIPLSDVQWSCPPLDEGVALMCQNKMGRVGKEGKPSYLAHVVFGMLMDKSPKEICNWVSNYPAPPPALPAASSH